MSKTPLKAVKPDGPAFPHKLSQELARRLQVPGERKLGTPLPRFKETRLPNIMPGAQFSPKRCTDAADALLREAIKLQETLKELIAETAKLIERTRQLMEELRTESERSDR